MATTVDALNTEVTDTPVSGKAHPVLRTLTGLAGSVLFLSSILFTLGIAPASALVTGLLALVLRARRRSLTRFKAWVAAAASAAVLAGAGLLYSYLNVSDEVMAQAEAAIASGEVETPEWLQRLAPASTAASAREPTMATRAFAAYFGALGGGIVALMIGAILGSVAWVIVLLVGHAVSGRWPFASRLPVEEGVA